MNYNDCYNIFKGQTTFIVHGFLFTAFGNYSEEMCVELFNVKAQCIHRRSDRWQIKKAETEFFFYIEHKL